MDVAAGRDGGLVSHCPQYRRSDMVIECNGISSTSVLGVDGTVGVDLFARHAPLSRGTCGDHLDAYRGDTVTGGPSHTTRLLITTGLVLGTGDGGPTSRARAGTIDGWVGSVHKVE